ncbi:MAG TPA: zf-TFIIB domain-containing protein [Candidatus Binatia bacterium]|nr:zf-TFIIB domain-containing protein [Candidatus Binatia bacterium]
MARCPHCDVEMQEVSARAHPGRLIVLDQCQDCGGIWCDQWELFPVEPEESERLDPLNEKLLKNSMALKKRALYCPRCGDRLQSFREPLLPSDVQLQRCRRCHGIWLNKGQFRGFKSFQRKTREEKMSGEEAVRKAVRNFQDPRSWVTTGTRGIFAYPRGEELRDGIGVSAKGAFSLILHSLLRLVCGF